MFLDAGVFACISELVHLEYLGTWYFSGIPLPILNATLKCLINLKQVHLWLDEIDDNTCNALARHKLKRISLFNLYLDYNQLKILSCIPWLESLEMQYFGDDLTFIDSLYALQFFTNLKMLNLACCEHVTDEILTIIAAMPALTHLDISDCYNVTSEGIALCDHLQLGDYTW